MPVDFVMVKSKRQGHRSHMEGGMDIGFKYTKLSPSLAVHLMRTRSREVKDRPTIETLTAS